MCLYKVKSKDKNWWASLRTENSDATTLKAFSGIK